MKVKSDMKAGLSLVTTAATLLSVLGLITVGLPAINLSLPLSLSL